MLYEQLCPVCVDLYRFCDRCRTPHCGRRPHVCKNQRDDDIEDEIGCDVCDNELMVCSVCKHVFCFVCNDDCPVCDKWKAKGSV